MPVTTLTGISTVHHSFAPVGETKASGTATAKTSTVAARSATSLRATGPGSAALPSHGRFHRTTVSASWVAPNRRDGAGVDGHRLRQVPVLGQQSGGEGHQGDQPQAQQTEPDDRPVHLPHIPEDLVVAPPERRDDQQTEGVRPYLGHHVAQCPLETGGIQSGGQCDVQRQQRYRDGEHTVRQREEPGRAPLVVLYSLVAVHDATLGSPAPERPD